MKRKRERDSHDHKARELHANLHHSQQSSTTGKLANFTTAQHVGSARGEGDNVADGGDAAESTQ